MTRPIKVLYDRIVVKPMPVETKTSGGIFIPDTVSKKPSKGTVVAVGPGRKADEYKMQVKPGDVVTFGKHAGIPIEHEGVDYLIMTETDIIAIV